MSNDKWLIEMHDIEKNQKDSISIIWWMILIGLIGMLIMMCSPSHAAEMPIKYVHDGDTIMTIIPGLPPELQNVSIRILGVDTPEIKGQCEYERQKAQEAKGFVNSLVGDARTMTVTNMQWDKYGGRIDGTVVVNGKNIAEELIKANLARPYHGEAKKPWCN